MSAPSRISVILPFRDRASTLVRSLRSVLSSPVVSEVVAVDDGSTDASRSLAEGLRRSDARVRLVESHGVGIARALAIGVEHATHGLLGRMDADDESLPGRFEASLALLAEDEKLGAVGTRVAVASTVPMPGLVAYVDWQNALVSPVEHAADLFVESPLCHPSVLLRREALDRVGGYRDVPWPEDYDLWLRMAHEGYGLAKVPRVLLLWHHHHHEARATFGDPRCAEPALLAARAHHLARHLARIGATRRPLVVWGAGKTGKRLGRALTSNGLDVAAWVDIDEAKLGRKVQNAPVIRPDALPADAFVLVAVRGRGAFALSQAERDARPSATRYARDVVRARLRARGLCEGSDFLCAA